MCALCFNSEFLSILFALNSLATHCRGSLGLKVCRSRMSDFLGDFWFRYSSELVFLNIHLLEASHKL